MTFLFIAIVTEF